MIKLFKKLLENLPQEKNMVYIYLPIFILELIYLMGKCKDNQVRIIHRPTEIDFSESKILGDRWRGIYKRKEKVLTKRLEKVEIRFQRLEQKFDGLTESIEGLGHHSESRSDLGSVQSNSSAYQEETQEDKGKGGESQASPQRINNIKSINFGSKRAFGTMQPPSTISFPVQTKICKMSVLANLSVTIFYNLPGSVRGRGFGPSYSII